MGEADTLAETACDRGRTKRALAECTFRAEPGALGAARRKSAG